MREAPPLLRPVPRRVRLPALRGTGARDQGRLPWLRTDRPLLGRLADGTATCGECAGITRKFTCRYCGYEGQWCTARKCLRCRLRPKVEALLDDGTGKTRARLRPLADYICTQMNPERALEWVASPASRDLLAGLASGQVAVSHEALSARPDVRRANYVRSMLVVSGVLPRSTPSWPPTRDGCTPSFPNGPDTPTRSLLRAFGTWHQLARMRARAVSGPLRETAGGYARIRFRTAVTFLDWADARGIPLKDLRQADVDAFYIGHLTYQQQAIRDFITWAVRHGHRPRVEVPVMRFAKGPGITQAERLALIKRFVTSDELHPHLRTAARLMLLDAQPLSRVLRLPPAMSCAREGQ